MLDAAEIVLAEVGVTATMDEIAEAAGIGRRTLFRYFPSREDLIAAAIERRYQRLDREVFDDAHLAADDPDELIRRADHDPPRRRADGQGALAGRCRPRGPEQARCGRSGASGLGVTTCSVSPNGCGSWPGAAATAGLARRRVRALESLFTYQALRLDFGRDEADIVDLTSRLMTDALHAALADAGVTSGRPRPEGGGSAPAEPSWSSAADPTAPPPPARR